MNDIDFVILAAGRGSRLEELTENQPKALVPFFQSSLLSQNLTRIRSVNELKPTLVTGYKSQSFSSFDDVNQIHNPHWEQQNMLGSLQHALKKIESQRPLIIAYSDIYISIASLDLLIENLKTKDRVLPHTPHWRKIWEHRMDDPLSDLETFLYQNQRVTEIGQRPDSFANIQGQFMGLIGFSTAVRKNLTEDLNLRSSRNPQLSTTEWIQQQITQGIEWNTYEDPNGWLEIDSKEDWQVYKALARNGELPSWNISFT